MPVGSGGWRTFFTVWLGQVVSLTGSSMTNFALGVWIYQETGMATHLALTWLFAALPSILLSPLAGVLVDRWDRRVAMVLSDAGAGAATIALLLLFLTGRLEVWHIYVATAVSSAFQAFQWPAWMATTSLLVPRAQFGRASGLMQVGEGMAQIVAPALAGLMVATLGIGLIMVIDLVTFTTALVTLAVVRFPRPRISDEGQASIREPLWRQALFGWHYIQARPGLLGLLGLLAASNFVLSMVHVLFTPLVLSMATVTVLGSLQSLGGIGFVGGSLLMGAWGGPRRRIYGIVGSMAFRGLLLLILGWTMNLNLLALGVFLYFVAMPVMQASSDAIWQSKVAADLQGRVFAFRRVIAWSTQPIAYLLVGPLVDGLMEPWMAPGGLLAGVLGRWIGVGPGRGIALAYVVMGLLTLIMAAAAVLSRRVRRVELDLPDADLKAAV